ncbi:spore photoproduct lyase family protein [Alkanindiges illinoisensis]
MMRYINRRALTCRVSNRSTNFIAPDLVTGCAYRCGYCYMRRNKPFGIDIAKNQSDIIAAIDQHVNGLAWPKNPDQTHETYWTYDIGCNTDVALHVKHADYLQLFDYFKSSEKAFGSFATKRVNLKLLDYDPNNKLRIRFSIMPETFRQILEPGTSSILERLDAVQLFIKAGWEVHLNYSPVIAYNQSSQQYEELFRLVDHKVPDQYKDRVKAEVIFLTHNEKMHLYNVQQGHEAIEQLLWQPQFQEIKQSGYGGEVLRYRYDIKAQMIRKFKQLHQAIIPWNTIRYIF